MLKKFLIGTFALAFILLFAVSQADAATLKVGSTGSEVMTVQTKVGVTADGKFGLKTKAAVMAFQANNGLVADGIVGAKTWAAILGSATPVVTTPGCTAGALFNSMTGASCSAVSTLPAGCTAGALFSSTTGASCTATTPAPVVTTSGEGSVAVSYDGVPADNLAVNRGEEKAVMAVKIKASGSDMKVSRIWLDINTRIWLSADKVTIMDGSTVVATLPLSSSTVTEVTAGSAWQLQFNGLNVVVPVGTTKVLTFKVSRPTLTSADSSVTIAATSTIRTVDGAGITDTTTLGSRTWNMAAVAASVGTLTNSLASTSPLQGSVSGLSATSGVTTDVKLMDFSLKATDGDVNVSAVSGTITTSGTCTAAQCISSIELRDGTTVLDSVVGAGTFTFNEQSIDVLKDATKTLSVWAKVNHVASSYVVAGDSITAAVTSVTGTSGPAFTAANSATTVTGNAQYLFRYAPTITLGAVSAVQADESTSTTVYKGANYSISFTVAAPAGSDIYVATTSTATVLAYNASATVGTSKSNSSTDYGGTLVTASTVSGVSSTGSVSGYDKVSAGTSRTFTITGYVPHGGTAGYNGMHIDGIKWNTTDSLSGTTIQTWGLSDFKTPTVYLTV